MLRALLVAALAAIAVTPASAGFTVNIKGLPAVQTVGVKVPLKLIQVSTNGGYDDPGEEWPGDTGTDEPDSDDGEWLDPPYPPLGDEPDDPPTDP
jgi:hypothetical protein